MSVTIHPPKPSIDAVTTIRDDGSRLFLHPADARGRFTTWRRRTGWLLIAVYLSLPWIRIAGHPAVFLDVGGRRFHLFGLTLAFQDAWLLFFAISGLGFGLFFVTALLGRVWCGWACPQTVFLDHVYRRIERWIEGDAARRRALDAAPWTLRKFGQRALKQTAFVLVSTVVAHLFLAYFVSLPELWTMVREAPAEHASAFLFVFAFTALLYFNFAWFREQLCIVICPYGRMQSALTDEHTLAIGYDARRGEPRTKLRTQDRERPGGGVWQRWDGDLRAAAPADASRAAGAGSAGDCVDCLRCVKVCPTGIDIRQGLQLECIGCAACVDACDAVMTKLGRPRGLIRYDSQVGLQGGRTRWWRPRVLVYSVLLLAGAAVATVAISRVRPASFGITRIPGAPYFVDATSVRNQFLVRLVNKRHEPQRFVLELRQTPVGLEQTGFEAPVEVPALGESVLPLVVRLPREHYTGRRHLEVTVRDEADTYRLDHAIEFVGPDPVLLREEAAR